MGSSYDIAEDIDHMSDERCVEPGDMAIGSADGAMKSLKTEHGDLV